MSASASPDRQHQVYAVFTARLKDEIRQLITPALIAEHRRQPLGPYSDALGRVVNFFRRPPSFGLYSPVPMREWQIIALPITPGSAPAPLDAQRYTSEEDAIHAVFLRHIDALTAEQAP